MSKRLASWLRDLFGPTRPVRRSQRFVPQLRACEDRLAPAAFIVNATTDTGAGVGSTGDLRYCLTQANATPGADTIGFTVTGTITLGSALPTISDGVSLTGPGATSLSVNGGGAVRVLDVAAGVTAAMSGLTVTGGFDTVQGAGIQNAGTLSLTLCVVSGNSANGGIVSGSGGGIFNTATGNLTLTDMAILGNGSSSATTSANGGGGVQNNGVLQVIGSTFAGNAAVYAAGGLLNHGSATITRSTFAGNSANTGGGIVNDGTLVIDNSTFADNIFLSAAGGIFTTTPAKLTNTIVARNHDNPGNPSDVVGALDPSSAFNLIGNAASSGGLVNGTNDNIVGVNPLLAPLGDYGGPTQTLALLPGSPAIDAGTGGTDQRGVTPVGTRDIGAFESRGFVITADSGSGQSTLVGTAFAAPLIARVTANAPGEPVAGGVVTFTPPASGASAALSGTAATIAANGTASVMATANGTVGSYTVAATANGATSAAFALTNLSPNHPPVIHNQTFHVGLILALPGTVVGTVQASDPDAGDTLTYQIVDGNSSPFGSPFAIDPHTGQLRVANTLALATGLHCGFDLIVQVTDSEGLSATAVIHIDVDLL